MGLFPEWVSDEWVEPADKKFLLDKKDEICEKCFLVLPKEGECSCND